MIEINKIYNEDCLGKKGMCLVPDKSIDMVLCDMPYGTTACKWDISLDLDELWKQYKRIIKDNGVIILTASQPFTSRLVMSNIKWFRYEWIWEKNISTGFLDVAIKPLKIHENILVFYNKLPCYNPQMEPGTPYVSNNINTTKVYGYFNPCITKNKGERYPRSIIKHNKQKGLHPTQKPITLFEYLCVTYTNPGDTVIDNCAGSGTTPVACIKTGRNFIAFEWSPKEPHDMYFNNAVKRIKEEQSQLKLDLAMV